MDPNQRIDYFRSEIVGMIADLRKEFQEEKKALTLRIDALEKENQRITRELRNVEMATR